MPRLPVSQASPTAVVIGGRSYTSFGGCNYLGLAHHPAVHAAMVDALAQFGLSTSASRETTGNTTAHDQLEAALIRFTGMPAAVVVPDGYTANLCIAQALAPTHQVALIDSRSHRSIREAVAGAGMCLVEFDHLDAGHAIEQMEAIRRNPPVQRGFFGQSPGLAIFTDGTFTADGMLAPIPELLAALPEHNAVLVVDDCHGLGVLGPRGQGTLSHFGITDPRIILTSTLAKGVGCHGGVVAGQAQYCDLVRAKASAYICTTPASPAIAAAATEALAVIGREPGRLSRLRRNASLLSESLRQLGLNAPATLAPIFAFTLESEQRMRRLHADLLSDGILAPLISYPGGPASCYFRLSVNSEHTPEQIGQLAAAMGARLAPARPASMAV